MSREIISRYTIAWFSTFIVFLVIDAIWLGLIAGGYYRAVLGAVLGDVLAERPRLDIALAFYLLYAAAIVILASAPAAASRSWVKALGLGAIFGLAAYGTYDITNLATLSNWPLEIVILDMTWGTFVTAAAALAGYGVLSRKTSQAG